MYPPAGSWYLNKCTVKRQGQSWAVDISGAKFVKNAKYAKKANPGEINGWCNK
jgi:hypothetical protein